MAARRQAELVARQLLEFFGIAAQYHDKLPGDIPYGVQRLLSVALAYGTGSKVLLLDEPAAGLGGGDMKKLADVLVELRKRNLALVVIEHHMDLIMSIADRIVMIDQGVMLATGTPAEIQRDAAGARSLSGARRMTARAAMRTSERALCRQCRAVGVAIDVPSGKMVGLVGANGAGKSTLVNALAGWSRGRAIVTGQVRLEGRGYRRSRGA